MKKVQTSLSRTLTVLVLTVVILAAATTAAACPPPERHSITLDDAFAAIQDTADRVAGELRLTIEAVEIDGYTD